MFNKIKKVGMLAFSMVAGAILFSQSYSARRYTFHFHSPDFLCCWNGDISGDDELVSMKDIAGKILKGCINNGYYGGDYKSELDLKEFFDDKKDLLIFSTENSNPTPNSSLASCEKENERVEIWVGVDPNKQLPLFDRCLLI